VVRTRSPPPDTTTTTTTTTSTCSTCLVSRMPSLLTTSSTVFLIEFNPSKSYPAFCLLVVVVVVVVGAGAGCLVGMFGFGCLKNLDEELASSSYKK